MAACARFVEGMSAATRVVTDLRTPIPRLAEETELTVYRIAQEALANAARHAGARSSRYTERSTRS